MRLAGTRGVRNGREGRREGRDSRVRLRSGPCARRATERVRVCGCGRIGRAFNSVYTSLSFWQRPGGLDGSPLERQPVSACERHMVRNAQLTSVEMRSCEEVREE